MKYDRVFCFGDSITLADNDSQGLGWPGRLYRCNHGGEQCPVIYNLGVNGDTSADIVRRWRGEAEARSREANGLIIFAFGFNDASRLTGGEPQVDLTVSLSNARRLLSEAREVCEILWIGPTPLDETVNPLVTDYASWTMHNEDISRYDRAYADLARTIGVDYLALFPEFTQNARYAAALKSGDGVHPGDDGYLMIAEAIGGWDKWQAKHRSK